MILWIKLIGILIACAGIAYTLKPDLMKKMVSFWREGNRLYFGGLLRILIGVIFLLACPQARHGWFIYLLGILMIVAAGLIFVFGLDKAKAMLGWWDTKPLPVLRRISGLIFVIGALVFLSA